MGRNIYRTIYLIIVLVGLLLQLGIFNGEFYHSALVYYTIQSNILCMVYFALRMFYDNKGVTNGFGNFIMSIHTKYSVTMCITLTFLVYHFLLAPSGGDVVRTLSPFLISNYILHYIIPIMTIVDLLIFDKHSPPLKWFDPFVWLIIPAAYFLFIIIRAPLFGNIGNTSSPYPYPFMDFTLQPASQVLVNIVVIVLVFIVLGYVLVFLEYLSRMLLKTSR